MGPGSISEAVAYSNPQYLAIDDKIDDRFEDHDCDGGGVSTVDSLDEDQLPVYDDLDGQLWSIFDNSSLPEEMARVEIDQSIHTTLMEHQREVVDFIINRDCGNAAKHRRLWTEDRTDEGLVMFRHKITGVPSPTPADVPGGILADDMGLGKTLSMIATIATTLASAKSYVNSGDAKRRAQMTPTPATLVIVPSALLLDNWLEEITKHVRPGTLRWHKYHGMMRQLDLKSIGSYDIVLSTYGTVAADLARNRGLLNQIHWYRIVLDEGGQPSLIFSFWKKTLDSVSDAFNKESIRYARVDGSLSQSQRKKALQTFRNDEDTRVLLVTFGTGSTGLNNLCIATRIHIFEPQWNPTVESQAIGRLFRHGQTNKVHITRYICQNTVEEAVESRQLRKVELAHRGGLHGSRNDRSPAKTRFMALRDYITKYMASDDFKNIDQ
ncbi:hypothetical protein INS49_000320 [Diaporthe citri]|uniref:uncharacterized protein n=1 Tax=Diaporthe citri TaxID=83186 RepID=UPI001C80C49D|nr:uncharacterized protein INS49_000320 [Diaporthe citri]KAG6366144.1 hypothetical protein INS49_000320 [Diaporthe citri]